MTYEDYTIRGKQCIKRTTLAQIAKEQGTDLMELIMQYNARDIIVVMWA